MYASMYIDVCVRLHFFNVDNIKKIDREREKELRYERRKAREWEKEIQKKSIRLDIIKRMTEKHRDINVQ